MTKPNEDVPEQGLSAAVEADPITDGDDSDRPLRRDVRMLGFELGRVLKRFEGQEVFDLVERVRDLSKRRRRGEADAEQTLRELIASLDVPRIEQLIHALACFFDLANLCEDRHRIRVLRERERKLFPDPQPQSIGAAVQELKERGMTAQETREQLEALCIELVFTAHPTEAKRRTVRRTLRRLRRDLIDLNRAELLQRERESLIARIQTDLACLWETDTVRPRRPTVMEEVDRGLFVAEELWDVVPRVCRQLRRALQTAYPDTSWDDLSFLRFGSWIGGDRDGNPFVTAEVTRRTLERFREAAVERHIAHAQELSPMLGVSIRRRGEAEELRGKIDEAIKLWPDAEAAVVRISEYEVFRRWLRVIRFRLDRTLALKLDDVEVDGAYHGAREMLADIERLYDELKRVGHTELAEGPIREWIDRVKVFGFHFASLDIRDESSSLHKAIGELMCASGICDDYAERSLEDRASLLLVEPTPEQAARIDRSSLTPETVQTLDLYDLLHRTATSFGVESLGVLIVSMTHSPADALTPLWLSRLGAARVNDGKPATPLPVVPLFETIADLDHADEILASLLDVDGYRRHVDATGGIQVCMVGYSDSTKDGGYVSSNWNLYGAQTRLAATAARYGVQLVLFHGRGGALGRGGGPAARGIRSLPIDSVSGHIRITEQGEVLAERYDDPDIAQRHLEQVTWATVLVSSERSEAPKPEWLEIMKQMHETAFRAYRQLIEMPGFVRYFGDATPIDVIENLPIGSRPSRRSGERTLKDLRAIPYTFAWVQSRQMLTACYGIGAALDAVLPDNQSELIVMYTQWRFFAAMINNAALALAKCDVDIARCYAELVDDPEAKQVWPVVENEIARATRGVLAITEESQLLDRTPWLQRSIGVRNPYIDPLNLIQIEMLKRRRALRGSDDSATQALDNVLRLSVAGIAAGMRTTG